MKIDNAHGARKGHERQKAARDERRRLERETRNAESRLAPARAFGAALKTMLRALPHVARMHVLALIEGKGERQLTFREWVDRVRPGYLWPPHLVALANVLQDVADGLVTRVMAFFPPRHGKALALDTPIPTPSGWRAIGELRAGDIVFAGDGSITRVRAVSPIWKNRPVYRVTTDMGHSVIADAAHEWDIRLCRKYKRVSTRETAWLYERGRKMRDFRAPLVVAHRGLDLPSAELPVPPYTLGAWLGDGSTRYGFITQSSDDAPHVLGRIAADGFVLRGHSDPKNTGILGLARGLRSVGVLGNKHIPAAYLRASRAQRIALLQGLVDTDGHVAPDGQVEFCSILPILAENVRELVVSLGVKASLIHGRATLNGRDCGPKFRIMFYFGEAASIPRKAARCVDGTRTPGHYLTIEPAGIADTVCIEVDHPSHLFLCGTGMVPTHNSEAISRLFSAYYLYRHPSLEVALTTYGADLSYELSRDARDNFLASGGELTGDANAVKAWNTLQGGRLWATGVGGPATGRGFHLGIIDDPYKDHTEAGSSIVRKSRLGWYRSVFFTRRAPGAAIVILLTRWHQADMAAELLKEEERTKQRWTVLDFPAEKRTLRALAPRLDPVTGQLLPAPPAFKWPSTVTVAPDVRDHVTWLWSARFSVDEYEETKRVQGGESGYFWNALFQQRPVSPEGGLFKREQIKRIARAQLPPMIGRIRRWDLAASANAGDFTAGLRVEKSATQVYYITALEHGQWDAGPRDAIILRTARVDGPFITQGFPVDPAAAGKQVAQQFVSMLDGISPVILMPETGDKMLRATHPSGASGNGMLYIVDEPWAETVIAELCAAGDGAEYWDIVDALSGAFTYLGPLREVGGHSDSHSLSSTRR